MRGAVGDAAIQKIIKKILIYRIFNWIASSIAMRFPCNDG
ncbi:hypothetical protein Rsl_673 [Rickettsia slovaca 13-B]|uniref:Uncharacterized protein n=1 Tax=Rickettsia slovaca (strain 13-B) TaxID=941638 RepID=A0ABM5MQH0_RICS1|nr:hypothetical protein Rsl_673 [Rickettsia slovaca 13-B]